MRRLWFVPLAVAAIGCANTVEPLSLAATDANVAGTYGLNLAGGQTLPLLAGQTTTQEVDLVADTLAIATDNTWTETSYYILVAFTDGSQTTSQTVSSGSYAIANNQINFTTLVGGTATFAGSVSGSTLSLLYNNARYVYGK
ncbi:MAG: hypothetical protein ABI442_17710 [Gemmatimonadaceae bacterium]